MTTNKKKHFVDNKYWLVGEDTSSFKKPNKI